MEKMEMGKTENEDDEEIVKKAVHEFTTEYGVSEEVKAIIGTLDGLNSKDSVETLDRIANLAKEIKAKIENK